MSHRSDVKFWSPVLGDLDLHDPGRHHGRGFFFLERFSAVLRRALTAINNSLTHPSASACSTLANGKSDLRRNPFVERGWKNWTCLPSILSFSRMTNLRAGTPFV